VGETSLTDVFADSQTKLKISHNKGHQRYALRISGRVGECKQETAAYTFLIN